MRQRNRSAWGLLWRGLAVLGLATLGAGAALAETGVAGRVLDRRTGRPLAGVQVTLLPGTHQACTDAEGRYRLVPLPLHGSDPQAELVFRRAGFGPARITVALSQGRVQVGDALLAPPTGPDTTRVTACAPRRADAAFGHAWVYGRVVDPRTGAPRRSGQVQVAFGDVRRSGPLDPDGFFGVDLGNLAPAQGAEATVQLVGQGRPISVFVQRGFHTVSDLFSNGEPDTRRAAGRPRPPAASRAPRERARPRARR